MGKLVFVQCPRSVKRLKHLSINHWMHTQNIGHCKYCSDRKKCEEYQSKEKLSDK